MECGKKELGELSGHLIALATICVWGSTFIFSKTLLDVFTPVQIMLLRFFVAYAVLWCMYPKTEKTTARDNLGIFFMSLFADTVYFLCENNALRYTLASNVSILVASAPIWTAVLAHFFIKGNKLRKNTVYGSLIALVGASVCAEAEKVIGPLTSSDVVSLSLKSSLLHAARVAAKSSAYI